MADFWGVDNILPGFDDDKGTSLILINSEKGAAIFSSIKAYVKCKVVNINQAILYNSSATKSVDYNAKRDKFFEELSNSLDTIQLIEKYTKISLSRKGYKKARLYLSRIKRKLLG